MTYEVRQLFVAGAEVQRPQPGDLFLTHDDYWAAKVIRIGQRLRYHGEVRKYAFWNHAGAFLDADGTIVEAMGQGVVIRNISKYQNRTYAVVRITATEADRAQMVRFYRSQAEQRASYGYATIVSIGLTLVTGSKFSFTSHASHICSGLCAAGITRGDYVLEQSPVHTMPADLAKMFDVPGPSNLFWQL